MTFLEALRASGHPHQLYDHTPIRQLGWTSGLAIWWSPWRLCWMFRDSSRVESMFTTPATMLADDWELAGL